MNEFELIARYFDRPVAPGAGVARGIGDDCALLDFGGATQLAVTTDMLLAGRHFHANADAGDIGHKALAVNLSDLAAAGAAPRCFFLALALPVADERWLDSFSAALLALADAFGCVLAGGDTTRTPTAGATAGPLTVCITAIGEVPRGRGFTRAGAGRGEDVWVSGRLGDAALALELDTGLHDLTPAEAAEARQRLRRPAPRVGLGMALRGIATACIDVSDGLVGDLGHILARSNCGATLKWVDVPRSPALRRQPQEVQLRCALAGGDDYELAFTAPAARRDAVEAAADAARTPVTRVGAITDGRDLIIQNEAGNPVDMPFKPYDHFGSYGPRQ
jgi:thiamine-monophosphate kinase